MVEEKRGAAVNAVVHGEQEEDKGDDRQEAIGSDNTGGDGATTDGLAELEAEDVVEEVDISMDRELTREGSGSKHPAPGLVVVSYTYGIM